MNFEPHHIYIFLKLTFLLYPIREKQVPLEQEAPKVPKDKEVKLGHQVQLALKVFL